METKDSGMKNKKHRMLALLNLKAIDASLNPNTICVLLNPKAIDVLLNPKDSHVYSQLICLPTYDSEGVEHGFVIDIAINMQSLQDWLPIRVINYLFPIPKYSDTLEFLNIELLNH
jgi:hypothetical protein